MGSPHSQDLLVQFSFLSMTHLFWRVRGSHPSEKNTVNLLWAEVTVDSRKDSNQEHGGPALHFVYFLETLRRNTTEHTPGNPERGGHEIPDWTDLTIPTPNFDQRITRKICDCGEECKNQRGLKIHQAKMKCMDERGHMLRTVLRPGETSIFNSEMLPTFQFYVSTHLISSSVGWGCRMHRLHLCRGAWLFQLIS